MQQLAESLVAASECVSGIVIFVSAIVVILIGAEWVVFVEFLIFVAFLFALSVFYLL